MILSSEVILCLIPLLSEKNKSRGIIRVMLLMLIRHRDFK